MRVLKMMGVLLIAVFALGLGAVSASAALPDVSVLPEGAFPLTASGETKGAEVLETVVGSKITCQEALTTIRFGALSSLGTFKADFTGCKEGKLPCKTEGDAKEVILVPENGGEDEVHVVFASPTLIHVIFLVPLLVVVCGEPGKTKIKIEGLAISGTTIKTSATEDNGLTFKGNLKGAKGKPEFKEYKNDEEKAVTAKLLSNFGLGFEESAEQIEKEVEFTANQMFKVS